MAEIRILRPGDESDLEAFLRPRLDSSIFLLSNLRRAGLVDRGEPFEGTYFAACEGGRIVGVAALYWQGNTVFQAPEGLDALLPSITAGPRPLRGLLGPAGQVRRARERLGLADKELRMNSREGLYRLSLAELAEPEALRTGVLRGRRIEEHDLDLTSAWRVAYCQEALGAEDSEELRLSSRAEMTSSLERGDTWVLEDGGERVASSSFNAALPEVVQVGGVWTPPEFRGRGYGRAAVAASLVDARAEGVATAVLFTEEENAPAIRAYAALGFRLVGDYSLVLFREPLRGGKAR